MLRFELTSGLSLSVICATILLCTTHWCLYLLSERFPNWLCHSIETIDWQRKQHIRHHRSYSCRNLGNDHTQTRKENVNFCVTVPEYNIKFNFNIINAFYFISFLVGGIHLLLLFDEQHPQSFKKVGILNEKKNYKKKSKPLKSAINLFVA